MSGIVWWEVETGEPERFQDFHGALWNWTFEPAFAHTSLGADYWIIKADDVAIGGLQRALESTSPSRTGARVYFEVDNLETAFAAIVENGGTIARGRTELGGDDRWFGIYKDPTGTYFGLWTAHQTSRQGLLHGSVTSALGRVRGVFRGTLFRTDRRDQRQEWMGDFGCERSRTGCLDRRW